MAQLSQLTDKELRSQLRLYGYGVGPITDSTRAAYHAKLLAASNSQQLPLSQCLSRKVSASSSQSTGSSAADDGSSELVSEDKKKTGKGRIGLGVKSELGDEASAHIAKIAITENNKGPANNVSEGNKTDRRLLRSGKIMSGEETKISNGKAVKMCNFCYQITDMLVNFKFMSVL